MPVVKAPSPIRCWPRRHLLGNGSYQVLVSETGTGFSRLGSWALTAWTADALTDDSGLHLYLRDLDSGSFWTAGLRPCSDEAESPRCIRSSGLVRLERSHHGIAIAEEICVIAPDAGEIRRITLRNETDRPRRIEITSFGEAAVNVDAAHRAHPAFSRLFVRTERQTGREALLLSRRPRAADETHPWVVHALLDGEVREHESNREFFLGRGGSLRSPLALRNRGPLSGSTGDVLDPCFALRALCELQPGARSERTFLLAAVPDRAAAFPLLDRFAAPEAVPAAFTEAAHREQSLLSRLGISPERAAHAERIAGALLYRDLGWPAGARGSAGGNSAVRNAARPLTPIPSGDPRAALAPHGIRPEAPLLVVRTDPEETDAAVRSLSGYCAYLGALGLDLGFVVLSPTKTFALSCAAAPDGQPAHSVIADDRLQDALGASAWLSVRWSDLASLGRTT